jgi:hypothetical protein
MQICFVTFQHPEIKGPFRFWGKKPMGLLPHCVGLLPQYTFALGNLWAFYPRVGVKGPLSKFSLVKFFHNFLQGKADKSLHK